MRRVHHEKLRSGATLPSSVYKKIIKSNLADNFYIRTHFDHEADSPIGLSFTRGEVFRVVDTMHRGKLGKWLAIRMGTDLHEMDKGIIPNQARSGSRNRELRLQDWKWWLWWLCFIYFLPPQGRYSGQVGADAEGHRGEAGVRAQSRVLETTGTQREQEERKDRPQISRRPAAAHHPGQIPGLRESPAQRRWAAETCFAILCRNVHRSECRSRAMKRHTCD